jgi:hypothetical protein
MKRVRKVHFWLGTFFAPSIIFFAFSGSLQILGLHEGSGSMAWVAKLAQIHKSQTIGTAERRARPPAAPAAAGYDDGDHAAPPAGEARGAPKGEARPHGPSPSQPLKFFFLLMAASLILSACLGVYMAVQYKRDRRVILGLLIAGTIVPIVLLFT